MLLITKDIASELAAYLASHQHDKVFVLTDTNTRELCFPVLEEVLAAVDAYYMTIRAGDAHKNITQVSEIWEVLSNNGASRNSLLINVGGGMITDLGGFAGATFKRGLHNLNIPTTLMASVDAAIGGKTGINFNGLKNEVGSFYPPDGVLIDCIFLTTLDRNNFLSGYAEVIKHGLISSEACLNEALTFDIEQFFNSACSNPSNSGNRTVTVSTSDLSLSDNPSHKRKPTDSQPISDQQTDQGIVGQLNELVRTSVAIKARIVAEDPKELGIRKALNFGHTIGHALESLSFAQNRPILHGHAVAAGIISELYLSHKQCALPVEILRHVINFIKEYYPPFVYSCDDYDTLYAYMTHDKKNESGRILFTLLGNIGDIRINQEISKELILESLDFYRENGY